MLCGTRSKRQCCALLLAGWAEKHRYEAVDVVANARGLVGLAHLGCVAHSAIVAGGSYSANGAPLLIALACGLAIGSMAVGGGPNSLALP